MRIVTLCENRLEPCFGLKASHGLSLYIEYNGHKILYDLGQDDVYLENAKKLHINLKECEKIIISHGHLDHAGGLLYYEDAFEPEKVVVDKRAFMERRRIIGEFQKDIGVSNILMKYKNIGKEKVESKELYKGIWCVSDVKLPDDYKSMEKGLFIVDDNGNIQDDTFQDELNLAMEGPEGLYVISGCSHRGAINIIKESMRVTNKSEVHTFVGGLHLNFAPDEEIKNMLYELKKFSIKRYVVGHCTGWRTISMMREILGEEVEIVYNYVGYEFN